MIPALILSVLFHMEQSIGQEYDLFYQACGCLIEMEPA